MSLLLARVARASTHPRRRRLAAAVVVLDFGRLLHQRAIPTSTLERRPSGGFLLGAASAAKVVAFGVAGRFVCTQATRPPVAT